jgi:hypothetical protein
MGMPVGYGAAILQVAGGVQVVIEVDDMASADLSNAGKLKSQPIQQFDGTLAIQRGMEDQFQAAVGPGMSDGRPDEMKPDATVSLPGSRDAQSPKMAYPRIVLRDGNRSDDNAVCFRDPEVIARPLEIRSFNVLQINRAIAGVDTSGQKALLIQSQYMRPVGGEKAPDENPFLYCRWGNRRTPV